MVFLAMPSFVAPWAPFLSIALVAGGPSFDVRKVHRGRILRAKRHLRYTYEAQVAIQANPGLATGCPPYRERGKYTHYPRGGLFVEI